MFVIIVILCLSIVSCEKQKTQGKVIVTEPEFVLTKDKENSFTIEARGKIKNVGKVDVKRVVVTGYCRSCGEEWIPGRWFISAIEKMPEQMDIISYVAVGSEESFSFKGIADLLLANGQETPELPEQLEIVIESFETVEE
jgi:hypothetical protein